MFVGGERVYLSNLWGKGVIKVNFVVIRPGRGNVISGFLGKYRGE